MVDELDKILNDFYLGKIDLLEVRKKILILYGTILPKGTLSTCACDNRKIFPLDLDTNKFYCINCGKEIE